MTQDTPIDIPSETSALDETGTLDYDAEPEEVAAVPEEGWLEEPEEELPRRPRRKLLGVGGNPIPLVLLVILLLAGAFFAGVQVEKGQTSSSATSGGLPSGFAALRSKLSSGGTSSTGSTGSSGGLPSTGASGFPSAGGLTGGGLTTGEVSFANGNTLYVTSSEGNTVKVSAPEGTKVSKTVTTNVHSIHPGDTVIVRGTQNKNGSVSASSISISSSGGSSASASGSSSSSTQQLFGSG